MGTGLFIFGIIILLILLVVGILMIVYKDRISGTNANTVLIIGIILVALSVILLILLIVNYSRGRKKTVSTFVDRTLVNPASVEPCIKSPENFQLQTNQPVLITVSPLRQQKVVTTSCAKPLVVQQAPAPVVIPQMSSYPGTVPVTILPNTNTEQIIGSI
jgi:hypothetical protein